MEIKKKWISTYRQQDIFLITLSNEACIVNIINYGAIVKDLLLRGTNNKYENLILSYDTVEEYYADPYYMGGTIGRYANRISGGYLTIRDKSYQLSRNENSVNHLHGGYEGFNRKVWKVENEFEESRGVGVSLSLVSHHLEEGYPGNLAVEVRYMLSPANELIIQYKATTDRPTVVNLTNHCYFNLSGGKRNISNHLLCVKADEYTPASDQYIPDGTIASVNNSIFDLRMPTKVAEVMHQIPTVNYCLADQGAFKLAATLTDLQSGNCVEVRTTSPGLQLYHGNYLAGSHEPFSGICLEPQHYPDSPNQPNFPSTLLLPGQTYNEITSYRFLYRGV